MSRENNNEADRMANATGFTALTMPSDPIMSNIMEEENQAGGGASVNLVARSPRNDNPNEKLPTGHEPLTVARPATPPPLPFDRRHAGEGSPRSPGGLAWRRAGSAHNLFPNQLISDLGKNPLKKSENLPRLVDRSRAFHQSSNKVHLRHNQGWLIYRLLRFNWFHVMLRWPSKISFTVLVAAWTGAIVFFALLYVWHDEINRGGRCVLGGPNGEVIGWAGAFAFSLQTCNTVGYTLPNGVNSFFEKGCSGLQFIIYAQMVSSMFFNAFLITFVYNRLGRSETRSIQTIFCDKALVSVVDGQVRFQVRIFDCDTKHPVVEAHVRMYGVMKQRPVPRPLRILQPDDTLYAMLFLSFPSVISHHIDMYSMLHPPVRTMLMKPKGLVLRQVDGFTANRNDFVCPICGESYGTFDRWLNHVRYQQIVESHNDPPVTHMHLTLDLAEIEKEPHSKAIKDIETLKQYFKENVSEIICLVEGIDPLQSGSFQAIQSYRFEDIHWETYAQFAPCLSIQKKGLSQNSTNRIFTVDLDRYHNIVSDPDGAASAMREDDEGYFKVEPAFGRTRGVDGETPLQKPRHRFKSPSSAISDSLFPTQSPLQKGRSPRGPKLSSIEND